MGAQTENEPFVIKHEAQASTANKPNLFYRYLLTILHFSLYDIKVAILQSLEWPSPMNQRLEQVKEKRSIAL
jgi:hypothetical protein